MIEGVQFKFVFGVERGGFLGFIQLLYFMRFFLIFCCFRYLFVGSSGFFWVLESRDFEQRIVQFIYFLEFGVMGQLQLFSLGSKGVDCLGERDVEGRGVQGQLISFFGVEGRGGCFQGILSGGVQQFFGVEQGSQ